MTWPDPIPANWLTRAQKTLDRLRDDILSSADPPAALAVLRAYFKEDLKFAEVSDELRANLVTAIDQFFCTFIEENAFNAQAYEAARATCDSFEKGRCLLIVGTNADNALGHGTLFNMLPTELSARTLKRFASVFYDEFRI